MANPKITKEDCREIRKRSDEGETYKSISGDFYNVSEYTIGYHVNNKCGHNHEKINTNGSEEKITDDSKNQLQIQPKQKEDKVSNEIEEKSEEDKNEINDKEQENKSKEKHTPDIKEKSIHDLSLDDLAENMDNINSVGQENTLFTIISSYRRRMCILIFDLIEDNTCRIGYLSDIITEVEYDEFNSDNRKKVYVGLYQHHLDRFDDVNIINWNKSRGKIEINKKVAETLADYIRDGYNLVNSIDGQDNENIEKELISAIPSEDIKSEDTESLINQLKSIIG